MTAAKSGNGPPDAEERVRRFRVTVSPVAYRLAVYLSAVLRGRWGLGLARALQEAVFPDSGQVHLAEVLVGGLVRPADQREGQEEPTFEFIDGVVNVLQQSLTGTEALRVLQALGGYIERETGRSPGIAALLLGETAPADATEEFVDVRTGAANLIDATGLARTESVPEPATEPAGSVAAELGRHGAGWAGYGRAGVVTVIEVAIGPSGAPGMFRVEVVASPAGEASATVELDADSLLARRGLLQQAVLASAVPTRRVLPETERPVREAGQVLFAGLLGTGEVAGRYRAAAAVAAERGEGLRVVLRIDTPALARLAVGGDVRPGYGGVRVPTGPAGPPRPGRLGAGAAAGPAAAADPGRGLLPARPAPPGRGEGTGPAGPRAGPARQAGPGRGALGAQRDLGRPAGPAAGRRVARAALHRARGLRPRPGRGRAGPGARGRARRPGCRAPADRPAAPGPPDAPPGGAEFLFRCRVRGQ